MSGAKMPRHVKGLLPGAMGDMSSLAGGAPLKKRPHVAPPGRRGR
jgi:hypothetical protein